jgi:hypothetical protein
MPRSVSIAAGNYNVELGNGVAYSATYATTTAGPTVILTDEEFAKTVVGTAIVDNGNVGTSVVTVQAANTANPAAATAVTTTAVTSTTPYGYATSAQATALVTGVNALLVDVASVRTALDNLLAALQVAGGPQTA